MAVLLTAGQRHGAPFFADTIDQVSSPAQWIRFGCLGPPGGPKLSLAAA
jgi:hypothetical protein